MISSVIGGATISTRKRHDPAPPPIEKTCIRMRHRRTAPKLASPCGPSPPSLERADPIFTLMSAHTIRCVAGETVSPSIGCPSNAVPVAFQSERSPFSKSRFSTRPSSAVAGKPSVQLWPHPASAAAGGWRHGSGAAAWFPLREKFQWLCTFPLPAVDLLYIVREYKRPLLVADDDVIPTYRR